MTESPQEKAEKARVRRRWLNLGELLAIVAAVISGLTLWNSYRERTNSEIERQADSVKNAKVAATLVLRATPQKDGHELALVPRSDEQTIQSQTIVFPTALGLDPIDTTGDARIERGWFDEALVKARHKAGVEDKVGDARLPVLVTTRFLVDGEEQTDRAIFQIGYETGHAFLAGTTVKLKGLSRVQAVKDDVAGKRTLDTLAKAALQ